MQKNSSNSSAFGTNPLTDELQSQTSEVPIRVPTNNMLMMMNGVHAPVMSDTPDQVDRMAPYPNLHSDLSSANDLESDLGMVENNNAGACAG